MSEKPNFEPFLDHRCIIFNGMFTIMDPVYGTSEINPIMLSIPKHIKGLHQNLNKSSAPPVRLLQSDIVKNRQSPTARKQAPAQNNSPSPRPAAPQEPASPTKQSSGQELPQLNTNPVIESFIQEDSTYWMQPLPLKSTAELLINIKKSEKGMRFDLFSDMNKAANLRSAINGSTVKHTLQFKLSDNYQVISKYDNNKNAFYAILNGGNKGPTEICCARYTSSNEFELFIPALKKNKETGKGYSCPISPIDNESALLSKFENKSKEVIRLLPRSQDSTNDPVQSIVLYHESNKSKDICNFGGQKGPNFGVLTVTYPLNIFQSFFAAIAANLTH